MMTQRLFFVKVMFSFFFALSALGEPLTFDPDNPPTQSTPPTEVYNEYTGTNAWRLGPKTMMVFRVYPSDRDPWTSFKSDEQLLSELMSMSANYYESSYHQTWFGPKRRNGMDIPVLVVTPPMQLPGTYEQYRNSFSLLQSHSRAAAEALGPEWRNGGIYHHIHYDRHVAMSNANMVGSAGLAYVNGKFSWTGGSLSGTIAVHELGHNWGVFHANSWGVPDGVDPEVHPRSPLRRNGEYQDGWCVMGGGTPSLMFNPLFRYRLGFLTRTRNEVQDITQSGTYRIYDYQHHDRRQTESLVRVLNIPITSYTAWNNVFLGFGHRNGTDGGWSRTDYNRNAVTVHSMMSSGSNRLDTTPNSRPGSEDRNDSSIKIGRTYSEGPNENGNQMFGGFHVTPVLRGSSTVNGQTHEWIEVVINYGNDVVGNQPPTASFSTTVLNGAMPGVPFELTVNASDPDGDDLAFDWNFGDDSYNIVNSGTQWKTWSEPGFYFVEVTVSDMKGGLAEAAVWVNVGDVPYRAPEAPAATLDGLHYTYFEGSFQQLPDFNTLFPVAEGTVDTFSLAPAQRNSNFAMLYTGYLQVTDEDVYTFSIDARDGVRFWIGDQILIENDGVKSTSAVTTGNIALQAGLHEVRLEFFHRTGGENLEVSWSTLDMPLTPIGASNFKQTDWQTNTPPTVSIVNPLEGETFLVGADLLITAEAADEDGIATVRFFANGNFIGEATGEPYSTLWENISVGTQELTALAVDNTGRTQLSNTRTIQVQSPPPTRSVGINFAGTNSFAFPHDPTPVGFADRIGAVYSEPYWNNFTKAEDDANNGLYFNLIDNDGFPTPIRVEWQGHTGSNTGKSATDTSTGNGRMMHGYVNFNNSGQEGPWLIARDIPYAQYDVYVYFDHLNSSSRDSSTRQFRIMTADKSADLAPPRYGQNSLDHNNGLGDYPTYDTWVGFKESTALTVDAPADERLGNYVVFRNITAPEFQIMVRAGSGALEGHRFMNGMQIVEVEATEPNLLITQPAEGWQLSEGGLPITYTVRLSVEPDDNVVLSLDGGDQMTVSPEVIHFTTTNWNQSQIVTLAAIDDDLAEGPHTGILTHTLSSSGNYGGMDPVEVMVAIADNDMPVVSIHSTGNAAKDLPPVPAKFQFVRGGISDFSQPLEIAFSMGGSASTSSAYELSGLDVDFDPGSGTGSVVIPAGVAQGFLTLTPSGGNPVEGAEDVVLTLVDNGSYFPGTPSEAGMTIEDNFIPNYFTQFFGSGSIPGNFDLSYRRITFTPDGSPSYYSAVIDEATEYPNAHNLGTQLVTGNNDDASYTVNLPASFYGETHSTMYVSANGHITFGSSDNTWTPTINQHFSRKRVSLFFADQYATQGTTTIYAGEAGSGADRRTVITFNDLHVRQQTGNRYNAQIEFWDNGTLTITWLANHVGQNVVVGLSNRTNGTPSDFTETNLSELGSSEVQVNHPPNIVSQPVTLGAENEFYSYTVAATDLNDDALSFTSSELPAGLAVTDHGNGTATLAGTPTVSGVFDITLTVSDGEFTDSQTFALTLFPAGGNSPPVFTSLPVTEAVVTGEYLYEISATDPEGHDIFFTAVSVPGWMTLTDHGDGTATLSGDVPMTQLSGTSVVIQAGDGFDSLLQSFTIVFERFPAIDIVSPLKSAVELPNLQTTLHIDTDVNGFGHPVALFWSQERGPAPAVFDDSTVGNPSVTFPEAGHYTLVLTADNGKGVSEKRIEVFANAPGNDVLNNGLLGHWRMNDPAGSSHLTDASANENHAEVTDNGNFQLGVSGYDGTALRLGGNGNFATAPLGMPQPMTASLWMLADASPSQGNGTLFSFIDGNGNLRGHFRMESGDTRLFFYSNHVSSPGRWVFEKDIPSGEWMHVVLTYDNSSTANEPAVWINGELVETTLLTAPGSFRSTSTMRIGSGTSSNTSWRGRIDELRLYDRIVPAEDVPLLGYPGPVNVAPVIEVTDQITGPGQTIDLGAVVTDDGLPNPPGEFEVLWVQEGGPDDAEIGLDTFADSSFTSGPFPAVYELRLFADDGGARVSRTMRVQSEGGDPLAPEITQQPMSLTVTELEAASFAVSVNANPAPEFQWRKDGTDIPGATQATYMIAETSLGDAGDYTVYIWNEEGNVTSEVATLTVNPIPPEAPVITQQPQSQSSLVTQTVIFSVEATGHPAPEFQWRKDGVELNGETGTSLTLTDLALSDSGDYDVVVSNSEDTIFSEVATLTVAEGPSAPTILTQPEGQTVTEGEPIVLTVEATGNPTPTYQWRFNGSPISGADQATFEIASAAPADTGSYDVVVSNSEGTLISDAAAVEVLFAPVISNAPQALTVTVGGPASFSVTATGNPAPTYQWYFDGSPLAGETEAVLSIAETAFSDAGSYRVDVSNSVDTVSSDAVSLTVNPGPVSITLQRPTVPDVLIPEGVGLVLETAVSEDGGESGQLTLLWELVSGDGTVTWDNTDLENTAAWFSAQGSYTMRLTADNGTHSETIELNVGVVDPALVSGSEPEPVASPMSTVTVTGWGATGPFAMQSFNATYVVDFADVPNLGTHSNTNENGMGTYIVVQNGGTYTYASGATVTSSGYNNYRRVGNSGDGPGTDENAAYSGGKAVGFGRQQSPLFGIRLLNSTGETIDALEMSLNGARIQGSKTFPFSYAVTPAGVERPGGANAESDGPLSAQYKVPHAALDMVVTTNPTFSAASELSNLNLQPGETLWLIWENPSTQDTRAVLDTIQITPVNLDQNIGPLVNAGPDQTVDANTEVSLTGTVEDDGLPAVPGNVVTEWIQLGGPVVSLSDPASLSPTFTPTEAGTYRFRLTAFDGEVATASDVTVTVEADESDPFQDWLADNGVEEGDQEIDGVLISTQSLYIMGAAKNESGAWQGLLRASSPAPDGNGGTELRFAARAGRRYTLERALDLGNPLWESVGESIVVGEDSEQDFPISIPQTGRAFYRIRVEME